MPEARDRRSSPLHVATIYARRRASILDIGSESIGSGSAGAARFGIGRGRGRARALLPVGAENSPIGTVRRGIHRNRATRGVLPSWYPRTPLRDITAVVRAIERRRARIGEIEGQQFGEFSADQLFRDESISQTSVQPEHSAGDSAVSPNSVSVKFRTPAGSKVPKILLDITNQQEGDSELTPEKRLLNSIDKVERVVKEELQKLKRTPSAKKAERERKVRTLMSMR